MADILSVSFIIVKQTVCDTVCCDHLDFMVHCLISVMWSQYSWLNSHITYESADGPIVFLVMTWRNVSQLFLWACIKNKCCVHWIMYFLIWFPDTVWVCLCNVGSDVGVCLTSFFFLSLQLNLILIFKILFCRYHSQWTIHPANL